MIRTKAQEIAEELFEAPDALEATRARFSEKPLNDAKEGDVIVYRFGGAYVAGVHLGNDERVTSGLYAGTHRHDLGYVLVGRGYIEITAMRDWQKRRVACFDAGAVEDVFPAPALVAAE